MILVYIADINHKKPSYFKEGLSYNSIHDYLYASMV